MEIQRVTRENRKTWNRFIQQHYPPVGAFMQTWEWGVFQEKLGREVERYFVVDDTAPIAAFMLVRHPLPLHFSYGYMPRGPVIATHAARGNGPLEIFEFVHNWIKRENLPGMVFVRMEPPLESLKSDLLSRGFTIPSYYIQPRYNHTILLDGSEDDILKSFHPSTRSNIRRAENRGVTVELKNDAAEAGWNTFFSMAEATMRRNSGKNVYPQRPYFNALTATVPSITKGHDPAQLSLGTFCAYEYGRPAATNFVLFFGDTATYLYGAANSNALRSKAATYLHWAAMQEARKRGLKYYDLGGIDEARWPTLTNFKRQFRGKEFSYMGNIDIPVRPILYRLYNLARRIRGTSNT